MLVTLATIDYRIEKETMRIRILGWDSMGERVKMEEEGLDPVVKRMATIGMTQLQETAC